MSKKGVRLGLNLGQIQWTKTVFDDVELKLIVGVPVAA